MLAGVLRIISNNLYFHFFLDLHVLLSEDTLFQFSIVCISFSFRQFFVVCFLLSMAFQILLATSLSPDIVWIREIEEGTNIDCGSVISGLPAQLNVNIRASARCLRRIVLSTFRRRKGTVTEAKGRNDTFEFRQKNNNTNIS